MKIVVDEVKLARNAKVARALVLGVVVVAVGMMIAVLLASMAPNSALFGQLNPATLLLVEIAVIILLFVVSRVGFIQSLSSDEGATFGRLADDLEAALAAGSETGGVLICSYMS